MGASAEAMQSAENCVGVGEARGGVWIKEGDKQLFPAAGGARMQIARKGAARWLHRCRKDSARRWQCPDQGTVEQET